MASTDSMPADKPPSTNRPVHLGDRFLILLVTNVPINLVQEHER